MFLDIAVGAIVIVSMVFGFRRGFVYTFIHTVDWLLAAVAAFIWSPNLSEYLQENTDLFSWLYGKISDKFAESLGNATISFNVLPKVLADSLNSVASDLSGSLALRLSNALFMVFSFILIVLAVKLVLWLVLGLLSKKHNGGFVGFVDGACGLAAGFVRGMFIVFVLLAVMLPLVSLLSPENIEKASDMLDSAIIAGDLYDNNLLLVIVRDCMMR